jgi:two-component system, oxyanion-binding sensor
VRAGWAEENPETAGRLMRALWRACRWLGDPGNRMTASEILAREAYLDVSADLIERALSGNIIARPEGDAARADNFVLFHEHGVNYPWPEQADWIGRGLAQRMGLPAAAAQAARAAFRGDLYAQHMAGTGADIPGTTTSDSPDSGAANRGDRFTQGRVFSPALPQ